MADEPQVVGKIDVQVLLQNLAESQRGILEERRNSARAIAEERERTRTQLERQKRDHDDKVRTVEKENEALARALGRAQSEVDTLRLENAVLKNGNHKAPIAEKEAPAQPAPQPVGQPQAPFMGGPAPVPGTMYSQSGRPLQPVAPPKVTVVPPAEPSLGKSVPMRPEGSETI